MAHTPKDYAASGLTIQYAMLDHVQAFPDKGTRPDYILWDGHRIKTGDKIPVPSRGVVRGEFLTVKSATEQGFDLKVNGALSLPDGRRVSLLRTWYDPRYEPLVEYPFESEDGLLHVWNVYRVRYQGGQVVEEKWTENAGFWVQKVSDRKRVYHCSPGTENPPDFESLVFQITVTAGE
jgi:hypothetical protein